jgi:hypothetical protein
MFNEVFADARVARFTSVTGRPLCKGGFSAETKQHAVVSCGVKPWFVAFIGARGTGKAGNTKMG